MIVIIDDGETCWVPFSEAPLPPLTNQFNEDGFIAFGEVVIDQVSGKR